MLGSNNPIDIDNEIGKLIYLIGSSLRNSEQLQEVLQSEKKPHIFFIFWLDTRAINLNETSVSSKDDDLPEFDFKKMIVMA